MVRSIWDLSKVQRSTMAKAASYFSAMEAAGLMSVRKVASIAERMAAPELTDGRLALASDSACSFCRISASRFARRRVNSSTSKAPFRYASVRRCRFPRVRSRSAARRCTDTALASFTGKMLQLSSCEERRSCCKRDKNACSIAGSATRCVDRQRPRTYPLHTKL